MLKDRLGLQLQMDRPWQRVVGALSSVFVTLSLGRGDGEVGRCWSKQYLHEACHPAQKVKAEAERTHLKRRTWEGIFYPQMERRSQLPAVEAPAK